MVIVPLGRCGQEVYRMAKAPSLLTKEALGPRDSQYTSSGCMDCLGAAALEYVAWRRRPLAYEKGIGGQRDSQYTS
ncbi:hypothetical protein DPMN_030107 [Dreissena polymorpha]|uniref:Uncharacterized protein n=1 Tax=Dreissena polymorpha TaxID=45954 RepID=A0A9D4RGU0_DREPO|nr:hypothetical protein DPMN_030107 [Dreissena polymorpha]